MAVDGGQFLAQGRERVTVARGGGVERDVQLAGDFVKGELAPNLKHEHFPLFVGQAAER